MKVEFYKHNIGEEEAERIHHAIGGIFLSTGELTYDFERSFSEYLGVPSTIGLMSCTAALHLSLLALGIGEGDEVITTPMTFIATATSILHAGAKPVFVDVEPKTGNLNAELVEQAITPKTRAVLPVHLYGHMCDMKELRRIADKHGLKLIEDSAHCIEGMRDGVRPGQLSDAACFSFYATKNMTCGEGGAVTVRTPEIADCIRKLSLHGMNKHAADRYRGPYQHWDMELLGWKCNLSNLLASMLTCQISKMEDRLARRELICRRYEDAFQNVTDLDFPKVLPHTRNARHLFTIWVNPKRRDEILRELQNAGIGVAVNYRAIHLLTYFKNQYSFCEGTFPVAEQIGQRTISLPLYPSLTEEEVSYVIDSVKTVLKNQT